MVENEYILLFTVSRIYCRYCTFIWGWEGFKNRVPRPHLKLYKLWVARTKTGREGVSERGIPEFLIAISVVKELFVLQHTHTHTHNHTYAESKKNSTR